MADNTVPHGLAQGTHAQAWTKCTNADFRMTLPHMSSKPSKTQHILICHMSGQHRMFFTSGELQKCLCIMLVHMCSQISPITDGSDRSTKPPVVKALRQTWKETAPKLRDSGLIAAICAVRRFQPRCSQTGLVMVT